MKSGCYHATLADKVKAVANFDRGADHSELSLEYLQEIGDSGAFSGVLSTSEPIRMTLSMGTNAPQTVVESSQQAKVSITLSTANGPLTLRNLNFLVFNHKMDEVILSRPLLETLGFRVKDHLSSVKDTCYNADFSHIGFSDEILEDESVLGKPSKLSSLLIRANQQLGTAVPIDDEPNDIVSQPTCSISALTESAFYGDHIEPE